MASQPESLAAPALSPSCPWRTPGCGSLARGETICGRCREALAPYAAKAKAEAERPECTVCREPIAEARRYRKGWVYHSTCDLCEQPVCEGCIGDADWDPDVGGFVHCKACVEARKTKCAECSRPGCHFGCSCGAWLCGPGPCAWKHEAKCEAVAREERR